MIVFALDRWCSALTETGVPKYSSSLQRSVRWLPENLSIADCAYVPRTPFWVTIPQSPYQSEPCATGCVTMTQ